MERAAHELTRTIMRRWDASFHIVVFAGPGNNGGDALAVARLLSQQNYRVEVSCSIPKENYPKNAKSTLTA